MMRTILTRSAVAGLGVLATLGPLLLCGCASSVVPATQPAAVAATGPGVVPRGRLVEGDRSFDRVVRRLTSSDFEARARANRALVAAGDTALPALGRAGDLPVHVAAGVHVSATRAVVETIMADLPKETVVRELRGPWANVRRAAAVELGRRDRWVAIPDLIASLEDVDPQVRGAAAGALRRLTNNFFDFRAEARAPVRRAASQRWRTWWSLEGRARAAERERGPRAAVQPGS